MDCAKQGAYVRPGTIFPQVKQAHSPESGTKGPGLALLLVMAVAASLCPALSLGATGEKSLAPVTMDDITGYYTFLGPHDTLAILEEDGRLKGYVDVMQEEEESDAVLSYQIRHGSRTKERVEFKTSTIHGKYYRFSGSVERGKGQSEKKEDYLRLVGDLTIITVDSETGAENAQQQAVIFKWKVRTETPEE